MSTPGPGPDATFAAGTGGDAVAAQLVQDEVDTVFGVPGIQVDYLLDGLARHRDRVRFVSCRHEQGAAYMADGYARATGRPGVFTTVPGPGVLNAMAGLATAYACSSPVVFLAGQIRADAIDQGLGLLHEIRGQDAVVGAVTKEIFAVRRTDELPRSVHDAMALAGSGRPRPVAVSMPDSVLQAPFHGTLVRQAVVAEPVPPDRSQVAAAAALLAGADRPVILAGWGAVAAGAAGELAALAEKLRAPVVMTANGRGAVSDRHAWALTSLGGRQVIPHADLVLTVGSRGLRMNGRPLVPPGTQQILLNADQADLGSPREATVALHGDARLGLAALVAELGTGKSTWQAGDLQAVREHCAAQIAGLGSLAEWVSALRAGMPEPAVLVGELTQVAYLARVAFPVYLPRTNLTAGYQGTLGYGVPTAIGAQLARPDAPVVSISGDGGFAYTLGELLTAVVHQVPATFVVFNDHAYGNVLRTQLEQFDGRVIGSELHNPSFCELGRLFGLDSTRVDTPVDLTGALRDAVASDRPSLIEVPVGPFRDPGPLVREGGSGG